MPPDPVPEKIRTTGKGHQGSHGSPQTRNTLIRPPDAPDPGTSRIRLCNGQKRYRKKSDMDAVPVIPAATAA